MDFALGLAIGLYLVNSAFLATLAYVYGKTALRTRAAYPVGLFIFSLLLLMNAAGTAIGYVMFSEYLGKEASPFMSVMGLFEFVGLLTLLRITL